jgi:hypothetical protein
MRTVFIAIGLAGALAACEVPTGPTPVVSERPPPLVPSETETLTTWDREHVVHPLFEDRFWQELIFGQHDAPGTLHDPWADTSPFVTASPNIYINSAQLVCPPGHGGCHATDERVPRPWIDVIYAEVPRLASQITGQPYSGRITEGMAERPERIGWIIIEFAFRPDPYACGSATVGGETGWIEMLYWRPDLDPDNPEVEYDWETCSFWHSDDEGLTSFPALLAHEFGHAMGLWHVADQQAVMYPGTAGHRFISEAASFSMREKYHAQLLYDVGADKRYCGWPFNRDCEQGVNRRGLTAAARPPMIVID